MTATPTISIGSATGVPWKLAPVRVTRSFVRKIGLSPTPFSSVSTWVRAKATASWAAPMTWGDERIEYASWTLVWIRPDARSLPSTQRRMARALRTAPAKPRSWWMRSSYGLRFASRASSDIEQAISACRSQRSMSWSSSALIAVRKLEPLIVARPSRARRPGIAIPARSIATRPGSRSPAYHASPSPMRSSAICAIGARSPLAPTEPRWQTTGVTPRFRSSTRVWVISGRQPE